MNQALDNWRNINETLRTATEKQCQELLKKELAGAKRIQVLTRIYGRFSKVRDARERAELLAAAASKETAHG